MRDGVLGDFLPQNHHVFGLEGVGQSREVVDGAAKAPDVCFEGIPVVADHFRGEVERSAYSRVDGVDLVGLTEPTDP